MNELQSKEFNDGSGLEFYDFNAIIYDQQIGRFIQVDPLTEDGGQERLFPFQFSGNNPSTFNDPDGKCPWCWGFVVGGAVEYGTQVFSNLINGQSLNESITNVDLGAIMVSAVAGAATGGISAIVPKSTGSKVAIEVLKTTIDASESAVQQYNDNGSVSLTEIVVDVATQKLGGEISRDLSLHSPSSINATERKLDRAQRVAAGDPASSGRASTVDRLNKKLSNKINTNSAIQQGATGAAANAMQALLEVNIDLKPNMELINPIKDNTNVVKPIFKIQ